jgi:hypothetical protein
MRAIGTNVAGLMAIVVFGLAARATAGDGCCAHCGCQASCQKVCRLVCEEKKVPVTCWGCKCEDFCIPGHSKACCQHCEEVCTEDAAACDAPCTHAKKFVWTEWIPGCAKLHTKKKLMKKTITKKVPSYKWVVEDLCCDCHARSEAAAIQVSEAAGLVPSIPTALAIGDEGQVAPASYTPGGNSTWFKSLLPVWKK